MLTHLRTLILLLLIGFSAKSQSPTGFPTVNSPVAYYNIGWLRSDSGSIIATNTPTFTPRFYGTEITYVNPGVDTSLWIWVGRWVKELKTGDIPNLTATLPIVYSGGNISCPTCGTGGGGISSLNGLTATTQTFGTGTTGTDFNIVSSGSNHNFNFPTASASNRGLLGTSDWSTFNSKQPQLNGTGFVKATGTTISYDNSTYYLASNPGNFVTLGSFSALSPALYNNATGVHSVDTTTGLTHLATQAFVLANQATGTITGAGNLAPLFTTSVSSNTLVFTLSNAAANSILGRNSGSLGAPSYFVPTNTTLNNWFGATIGTVTGVTNSDGTITIGGTSAAPTVSLALGHPNTWTGVQTQPAPIFTSLPSAGANDSVLTVDPSTGQVHRRSGTSTIGAVSGVSPYGTTNDSFALGNNPLLQNTTIPTSGFTFSITGLPNKTVGGTDSALIEDASGKIWKALFPVSGITSLTTDVVATGPGAAAATIQPLAITTGKIAANAVTLPKLATGPSNQFIVYDGSGNPSTASLTTTGTSGAATLSGGVLNIPQYSGGGGGISQLFSKTASLPIYGTDTVGYALALNVKDFGAVGDGVHNDGPAIRAAIAADSARGGGHIYFPLGIYLDTDSLDPSCNCQLRIPSNNPITSSKYYSYIFDAEPGSTVPGGGYANTVSKLPTTGVIIRSGITSNATNATVFGTTNQAGLLFNYNNIAFNNITVQTYTNHGAQAQTLSAFGLWNASSCQAYYCNATTDTTNQVSKNPIGNEVCGFCIGNTYDGGPNFLVGCQAMGYKYGFILSEETSVHHCYAIANNYGLVATRVSYPICGSIVLNANNWGIYTPATSIMNGVYLSSNADLALDVSFEYNVKGFWYDSQGLIKDSLNLLTGQVRYLAGDSIGAMLTPTLIGANVIDLVQLQGTIHQRGQYISNVGGANSGLNIKATDPNKYALMQAINDLGNSGQIFMGGSTSTLGTAYQNNLTIGISSATSAIKFSTPDAPIAATIFDNGHLNVGVNSNTDLAKSIFTVVSTTETSVPMPIMTHTQVTALTGIPEGSWVYDKSVGFHTPYYYNSAQLVNIVPFGNAGDVVFQGVNGGPVTIPTIHIDSTNARLGIGTSTPATPLELKNTINGVEELRITNLSPGTAGISLIHLNNSAHSVMEIGGLSSGYTTSGLLVANGTYLYNGFGPMVLGTNSQVLSLSVDQLGTPALQVATSKNVLIGGTADNGSLFQVKGSVSFAYNSYIANHTATATDWFMDCTLNSFTITLPTAVGCSGRQYIVKNTSGGVITMATTSSQTIDGAAPGTVSTGTPLAVVSDGANWKTLINSGNANFYTTDGTLTSNRTVTQSNNSLTFTGGQEAFVGAANWNPGASIPGSRFEFLPGTLTDNVTAASGTVTNAVVMGVSGPLIAATNTGVNVTNAYTLLINGSPQASTNVTLTNGYSLGVVGPSSLGGNVFTGNLMETTTPTIAAGTGAGTSPTISISGSNQSGLITITTGTAPTLSAVIATITYGGGIPFKTGSYPVLFPANAATALLSGTSMVFTTGSTTNFTMTAGTVALTGTTVYSWYFKVGAN